MLQALAVGCLSFPARSQDLEVSTPLGRLQGIRRANTQVFLGVPFAEPPVDQLRFKAPLPNKPWQGVRAATVPSAAPIQSGQANISEDCLYLNVFAPTAPGPHPVFLWIYGGGNTGGSANNPHFDGSTFARDGVVCVVINYRVGALGFLELGNLLGQAYQGSGNNGIKDQVQALRWVRQNISAFGGDAHQVTVGGQSAGAKNVAALMASPQAKGLFQRAIIESGSAQTVYSLARAQSVSRLFLDSAQVSAGQLLAMSSADLLAAQRKLLATYPANYPFRPVVDGDFLPGIPLKLIANGSSAGVDLLIGTCRDESAAFVDPEHAAQPLDQKELGNAEIKDLAPVEAAYKSAFPDVSTPDLHIRMLTAEEYWIPCVRIAEARAAEQAPTFMYRFDHAPTAGRFANKSAHGSEQPFAWDHADQKTQLLASRIHAAWVAFIKTGHPASPDLPAWPAYQLPARSTMLLNDVSRVAFDPNGRERQIWNNRL